MTLGEKIKKYRELRGLTQKALGERVGFSIGTQDSRIRKYEKDMMAPKEDIRIKIAEALDIDMSALNDIDIQTEEDAIRILFYLEEKYGLEITKTRDEILLTFDSNNTNATISKNIVEAERPFSNWKLTKDVNDVTTKLENNKFTFGTSNATIEANYGVNSNNTTLALISKAGHTCKWNTKSDGSGTSYSSGYAN